VAVAPPQCTNPYQAGPEQEQRRRFGGSREVAAADGAGADKREGVADDRLEASGAANADGVGIQRHGGVSCQGATATNCCPGIQGDGCGGKNISFERSGCIEHRGAADHPKHAVTCTGTCHENRCAGCSRERAPYLEHEDRIVVALVVESERSRQLSPDEETL
jgi:hypothetical protein